MEHHSHLLEGLNQLREKGQLLDVTLWAENRPFQVGQSHFCESKHLYGMTAMPFLCRGY